MEINLSFWNNMPEKIKEAIIKVNKKLNFSEKDFISKELLLPSVHLLNGKGKMLRPMLVLLCANALGGNVDGYIDLAAAIEMLHVSSLVHDDIIDGDTLRRNTQTVNAKYGNDIAILAGDALIAKAISFAARYGKKVVNAIAGTSMEMCAGELYDYSRQKLREFPGINGYIEIARLKTASIIGTACSIAAMHMGRNETEALKEYGINIGLAFQIRDDVLDYSCDAPDRFTNAVAVLKNEGSEDAVGKAKELNKEYVKKALASIEGIGNSDILKAYARELMI
ncbi:MAG: polyprenyl synthetase family protein [Candidatus Micrarchaeaceae archaeon]